MEICIDSVESAIAAQDGGAARVELCANLFEGGTTPSLGLLQVIKQECPALPVFILIRPRGGDFVYSILEFQVMKQDIKLMKEHGADGFVLGVLTNDGNVDKDRCRELMGMSSFISRRTCKPLQCSLCRPLPTTFHRAFDMCADGYAALEDIISLGFDRLLTSGQESTVLEGLPMIAELVTRSQGRIIIMPGGGITERNLQRILDGSGVKEFHCSARTARQSQTTYRNPAVSMGAALRPPEFSMKQADSDLIRRLDGIQTQR
ncbi:copper homeostasis protein cutC homolog isoform X1 [Strongylocentrotus purpuratus]|uniref:Copper homeostasis protein cutC homolog n=1 Tax=Strongylocentrotus purpuratus TaxID=7668 RepID=A0A7M7NYZ7_STRPU|nr:copper homeostasis protein cutC homolog isoform X1 [Strongylocentrotus purpuratus]